MSTEFNKTSGYIAVLYDEKLPEEIVLGDEKTYESKFKRVSNYCLSIFKSEAEKINNGGV